MSLSVDLYGLTVDMVDEWWPHVSWYIKKAVDYSDGKYTLEWVYDQIKTSQAVLWVAVSDKIKAAGVTQVQQFPGKKVCVLIFAGGEDFREWSGCIAQLERAAIEWGCESFEIHGRKGWERVFPDYQKTSITLSKALGGNNGR